MINAAQENDSISDPGRKMFQYNVEDGASTRDALALINNVWGIPAYTQTFPSDRNLPATLESGRLAMNALGAALARGYAVTVVVNSSLLWPAAKGSTISEAPNYIDADHVAVVTFIDLEEGKVFLNDSGPLFGKNMQVPIGAFLSSWQADKYEMTIVGQAAPSTTA
jgi:hypothetical protein